MEEAGQQGAESRGDFRKKPRGEDVGEVGDPEGFLGGEGGGNSFGGGDTEGIAVEADFRYGSRGVEKGRYVGLDRGGGVEFKGLVGEGEDVGFCSRHIELLIW